MDMQAKHQDQLIFHLTGRRPSDVPGDGLAAIDSLALRPALLAPYRDLGALRHDFPIVLVEPGGGPEFAHSLSSLVNTVLADIAPRGVEGERMRRHALQLEHEIRRAVDEGAQGSLAELWQRACERLGAREGDTLEQLLVHAGGALRVDGQLLGCNHEMPARLIAHAWQATQRAKARRFRAELARLVIRLSDILRAAHSHSQAGRQPQSLQASLGGPHQEAFDFEAFARIVGKGAPRDELPPSRRDRITQVLGVLESQRFYAPTEAAEDEGGNRLGFCFDNCQAAAEAFGQRLGDVLALVKAISIAELEVQGHYRESEHDLFFEALDVHALVTDDLARFPDYLVCIPPARNDAPENANLMAMLSSGLPVKVLVQTDDLLEEASIGTGEFAFGVRSARLATAAMSLGGMHVLQSPSANLYAMRAQIGRGMAASGPALFSVYAGSAQPASQLPPYLTSAAALQSRAFPAFSYDAAAGGNWATRFSLENNPQPEDDWSVQTLEFVDAAMQRASERCAFTYADFALCDARHAAHFALVPRERWNAAMLPAAEWLALDAGDAGQRVPYLLAVDGHDALQRVIVDARMMQATRRCLLLWRRLQEHGGVHDSHAERLLAREKAAWEAGQAAPGTPAAAAKAPATGAQAGTAASAAAAGAATAPATGAATAAAPATSPAAEVESPAAEPAHSPDEAWIETARCPSCNECQLVNPRMFAYDERQQAYIKDVTAGTYRQLVEAAESCQVAIIHPGKPRDPDEAGLEELLLRAEPFR
jgi:ferredoxin